MVSSALRPRFFERSLRRTYLHWLTRALLQMALHVTPDELLALASVGTRDGPQLARVGVMSVELVQRHRRGAEPAQYSSVRAGVAHVLREVGAREALVTVGTLHLHEAAAVHVLLHIVDLSN